jgi:hypothetical protein
MDTGDFYMGIKRPVREAHRWHIVPRLRMRGVIPPWHLQEKNTWRLPVLYASVSRSASDVICEELKAGGVCRVGSVGCWCDVWKMDELIGCGETDCDLPAFAYRDWSNIKAELRQCSQSYDRYFKAKFPKFVRTTNTRWFKYDRDKPWLVYTQSVPVIFEPPCIWLRGSAAPVFNPRQKHLEFISSQP